MTARISAAAAWGGIALTAFAVACAPAQEPTRATISLRLHGGPAEAAVVVDEESIGALDFVAAHGVALPPGIHHVTVKAQGYFPWDREVEAKAGAPPIVLEVAPIPMPD